MVDQYLGQKTAVLILSSLAEWVKHNSSNKMCGVKCITFVLWINILSVITGKKTSHSCLINFNLPHFIIFDSTHFSTGESDLKLELSPKDQVIHVGEDLELTCRANDCPVNVTFVWRAALDHFLGREIKTEQTVSRLLIRNISVKHSDRVVCKATCQQDRQERTSKIHVFCKSSSSCTPN